MFLKEEQSPHQGHLQMQTHTLKMNNFQERLKFSFLFYCVDTAGCVPRLPEVHSKPSLLWHKEQYCYLQLVFIWGSVLHSPLPLSVRGSCSMVLVCGPVMCHLCLKVAIILSALRANKGCHPVGTHLWLFSRGKLGFGPQAAINKSLCPLLLMCLFTKSLCTV